MTKSRILLTTIGLLLAFPSCGLAADGWQREIAIGYNKASGNTNNAELNVSGAVKRAWENSEFLSAIDVYYSETNEKMNAQQWHNKNLYSHNFGRSKRWFNTYEIAVSHDYFANIHYRLLPSVGLGYWLAKEERWRLSLEGSLGYEITEYRVNKDDDKKPVSIARIFAEKAVFDKSRIAEDFSLIPSLTQNSYRICAISSFTNPLSKGLDLVVKYILDYDSDPATDKKKQDTRFITAIKYSF